MSNFMDLQPLDQIEHAIQVYHDQIGSYGANVQAAALQNGGAINLTMAAYIVGAMDAVIGTTLTIQAGRREPFDRAAFLALIEARLDRMEPLVAGKLAPLVARKFGSMQ